MLYFITHQGIANYTTVKYKYTPTRMAKTEKTENPKYGEYAEKLKLSYIMSNKANNNFGEKKSSSFSQFKPTRTWWPAIQSWAFTLEKWKHWQKNFYKNTHSSFIHNSQKLERAQVFINRRMSELKSRIFMQWNIPQQQKRAKVVPHTNWINLKNIMLSQGKLTYMSI